MCGIAGIVGCSARENIESMVRSLDHRGPDDSGVEVFVSGNASLGHTRLSILDLSQLGHQPMSDLDRHYWITYNGEIYNYRDVRHELAGKGYSFRSNTDTEAILYAYKEWGADCLDRLNGMFAFGIWDTRAERLFLARDRVGIKPIYYWHVGRSLVFASEIKAIVESGLVHPEVDFNSLHTPAMYQVAPYTGFKGIHKLLPGHYLTFHDGRVEMRRYWKIEPACQVTDLRSATDTLDDLLRDTVAKQMLSDVPIGLLLSGGLDSSLLLALMGKSSSEPINTFTIRFAAHDQQYEQMSDDGNAARVVARQFRSNHKEIEIQPDVVELLPKMMRHMDEPLADPAAINTFLISRAARDHGICVLLSGMGADEIFGGYRKYLACLIASQYQYWVHDLGQSLVKQIVDGLPAATSRRGFRTVRWAKRFLSFAALPEASRFMASATMDASHYAGLFSTGFPQDNRLNETHFAKVHNKTLNRTDLPYVVRMCLTDMSSYITDHNLLYSDKSGMAASVEIRPPFTDHRVVEYMFSTHPHLRVKGLQQKVLLKSMASRYLPPSIVHRSKAPFGAPLRSWIRGSLSEMIGDYLSPGSLRARGLYNSEYVWERIEKDRKGLEDNAHLIWMLLCTEVWFRTFFGKTL